MRGIDVLRYAIEEHKPVAVYALFSGGKDSLTSTHWAMNHGAQSVVHINTGIGVNEGPGLSVEEYVRETCKAQGWPLRVVFPPDLSYREMVLRFGFPGPGAHRYPYVWLKERCVALVQREAKVGHKRSARVMFATGVHQSESARRMGYVCSVIKIKGRVWVAPLFDWNAIEFADYRKQHGLDVSPIVKLVGMSGECWCGAFAEPNELVKIERYFPKLAAEIHKLQGEAKASGVHASWGVRPPRRKDERQGDIPFMPLCVNCQSHKPKAMGL